MRRCLIDDLLAGAGRLARESPQMRPALALRLVQDAHAAHHYMRRLGRPHPRWGNGSLMARALCEGPVADAPLCLEALALMARVVARFRRENSARGHGLSAPLVLCYDDGQQE